MREVRLERAQNPSIEEFVEISDNLRVPVLVKGAMEEWPALGSWSLDYVSRRCGDRLLNVEYYDDGDMCGPYQYRPMSLSDYVGCIRSGQGSHYYLAEHSVEEVFPEIVDEVGIPPFVNTESVVGRISTRAVFAGVNTITAMHYHDVDQAVLCQLHGTKRILFYAPWQTRDVRPRPWYASRSRYSSIMAMRPNTMWDRFAEEARSEPALDVTLSPGDMLFIPIHWWHVAGGNEESISMTVFWRAYLREWFFPTPGVRVLGRQFTRAGFHAAMKVSSRVGLMQPLCQVAERAGLVESAEVTKAYWDQKLAA